MTGHGLTSLVHDNNLRKVIGIVGIYGRQNNYDFYNYYSSNTDFTVDLSNGNIVAHNSHKEDWKVTLIDTGLNTMTGGRIKRIHHVDVHNVSVLGIGVSTICVYGE